MDPDQLSTAFAVWAAVVAMVGAAMVYQLAQLRAEVKDLRTDLHAYVLQMERRVTHIETHMGMKHEDFRPKRATE